MDSTSAVLLPAQQRLLVVNRMEPDSPAYNVAHLVRLRGELDIECLKAALGAVVARQGALRARFLVRPQGPRQFVDAAVSFDWAEYDLSGAKSELQRHSDLEARAIFDLAAGPMLRASLYQLGSLDHGLLLVMHHIVCDGVSFGIFLREFSESYNALIERRPVDLAPLIPDYAGYLEAYSQVERSVDSDPGLAYWLAKLQGAPEGMSLPGSQRRIIAPRFAGQTCVRLLPHRLLVGAEQLARAYRCTLFVVLLAAYKLLLYRYGAGTDLVVGTPFAGRTTGTEHLIGMFANTIALRTDLSGSPSTAEMLDRVRTTAFEAFAHSDVQFEDIVSALQTERTGSGFVNTLFSLHNSFSESELNLTGLASTLEPVDTGTTKFDLTCSAEPTAEGLLLHLQFRYPVIAEETARQMLEHYELLLEVMCAEPLRSIDAISLVAAVEQAKLVGAHRSSQACTEPVHRVFEKRAASFPAKVALRCRQEALSYDALNTAANRLAQSLRRRVSAGERIGIYMERSLDAVVALLATLKAGCAYVPLPVDHPEARLRHIIEDAGISALLTGSAGAAVEERFEVPVHSVEALIEEGTLNAANPGGSTDAEQLAYVIYTSGSTGTPNGVAIPHRGITNLAVDSNFVDLSSDEVFLQAAPMAFDAFTFELWGALLNGAECVIYPDAVPSPAGLAAVIRDHGVSTMWLTASLFNAIVDEAPAALTGVRQLLIGGEALSVEHVCRAQRALPDTRLINGYGPTECTTFACTYPIPVNQCPDDVSIPIGRPLVDTSAYVLDAHLNPVPCGAPGELYLGGRGLALGYVNRPAINAARFIEWSLDGETTRLYRTGDSVTVLASGEIVFLGRMDDQVKLRGHRIELAEIDHCLTRIDGITQAKTVLDRHGVTPRLSAYVVGQPPENLRALLAEQLPSIMIPSRIERVALLPITSNGKLDLATLQAMESAPSGGVGSAENPQPDDDIVRWLLKLWRELLSNPTLGVDDDFFEHGGDSLLALRIMQRIDAMFGQQLPLAVLFDAPTVRSMAEVLRVGKTITWSPLVRLRSGGDSPPLFLIHSIGGEVLGYSDFVVHLHSDRPVIGVQARGLLRGQTPFTNLQAMAAFYVSAIRAAQPQGPYYIGGLSMGGLIAHEVAIQLQEGGDRVAFLMVGDTWFHSGPHVRFYDWWRASLVFPFTLTVNRVRELLRARERRRIAQAQVLEQHKASGRDTSDLHIAMEAAHRVALEGHQPGHFSGTVTLFRSAEPSRLNVEAELAFRSEHVGWDRLANNVMLIRLPGSHHTMFYGDNARRFARILGEEIQKSV